MPCKDNNRFYRTKLVESFVLKINIFFVVLILMSGNAEIRRIQLAKFPDLTANGRD
jgi:hypothetical protein